MEPGATTVDWTQAASGAELPELAAVHWRPRVDEGSLRRADRMWTLSAVGHAVPFVATAIVLAVLDPLLIPFSLIALGFAWVIPELYAARGAGVLRPPRGRSRASEDWNHDRAQSRALGLLADLVDHEARDLLSRCGMALQRGAFGVWLVAPAGALLVRPGGRRVQCYCVRVPDADLPTADRVAHLLLALREDESGFATVANLSYSGSRRRLRRRLAPTGRDGLAAAVAAARGGG
ncbi:MAG: hypothetical protein WAL63_06735 [Solirubrobacteraceae bacterium]